MSLWPTPNYPNVFKYKRPEEHNHQIVIAGPCSIESEEQTKAIADELSYRDIDYMRGGVYRAGTYPRDNYGMQRDLLEMFYAVARIYGLKTIIEVIDIRQIEMIDKYADAFQVGARHMQDYALLTELSGTKKTVALKRNMGAKLDEFLGAAEYLCRGTCKPILIERGSSTFHDHVRWDLSISMIAAIKRLTDIPILVDPSHGTGRRNIVEPMARAGIAAGADGITIEVHPNPDSSLSDANQAFPLSDFGRMIYSLRTGGFK
jgi:3-deoxy-7-phosphoheptulonate synthase